MPPRKSNVSLLSANGEAGAAPGTPSGKEKKDKDKDKDEIAIEDLTMPRTMIQRLAKGVLPEGTQLQKDAVTALCKSATVFVSHIAGAASDECSMVNRRTVNPADVFAALRETEHAGMIPRLEQELAKYIEVSTNKRNEYRRKMKEKTDGTKEDGEAEDPTEPRSEGAASAGVEDEPRSAKRVKGADGAVARAPGEEGDDDTMEVDDEEGEEGEEEEEEDDEEEEEEEGDEEEEDEDGDDDNEIELDPAAAQLEREIRAVNDQESGEDSD